MVSLSAFTIEPRLQKKQISDILNKVSPFQGLTDFLMFPITGELNKMAAKKFRVQIAFDECKGCGRCLKACPKKLLAVGNALNKQGYLAITAEEPELCIGCGSCFYQCPEPGAITIVEITE